MEGLSFKQIIAVAFTVATSFICKAQNLQWHNNYISNSYVTNTAISQAPNSSSVSVVGFHNDTLFIDSSENVYHVASLSDGFLINYDALGNINWSIHTNGAQYEIFEDVTTDKNGNVTVIGKGSGGVFDPDPSPLNNPSVGSISGTYLFIIQYDSLGQYNWSGYSTVDDGYGASYIESDSSGNLYVNFPYEGSVDANFSSVGSYIVNGSSTQSACFVAKYSANGTFLWVRNFAPIGANTTYSMAINEQRVAIAGSFGGSMDIDPGAGNINVVSGIDGTNYAVCLDLNGNYINHFLLNERIFEMSFDPANNIAIAGIVGPTPIDFDYGPGTFFLQTNSPVLHAYVGLYNADFKLKHAYLIDAPYRQEPTYLKQLGNGKVFLANNYRDTITNWYNNHHLSVLDSNGIETVSFNYLNTKFSDWCFGPTTASSVVNYFDSTDVDITPMMLKIYDYQPGGDMSSFVANYDFCQIIQPDIYRVNNQLYSFTNYSGDSYQWYDCSVNQVIPGANAHTYTPNNDGSYALIISHPNGCIDTSDCFNVDISFSGLVHEMLDNLVIYPNPTLHSITINGDALSNQLIRISMYNLFGQCLVEHSIEAFPTTMDVEKLAPGVYYLYISIDSETIVKTLVKV